MFNDVLSRKGRRKGPNIFLIAPVVAAALLLGLLIPSLIVVVFYWLLSGADKQARPWLLAALAVTYGQALWLLISGFFAPGALLVGAGSAVVFAGLGLWLQASRGAALPAVVLIGVQVLSLALTAWGAAVSPVWSGIDTFTLVRAMLAQGFIQLVDVVFLVLALQDRRGGRPAPGLEATSQVFD